MFTLYKKLPYLLTDDFSQMIPCELSADKIILDKTKLKAPKDLVGIFSYAEIMAKLGICFVDGWDAKNKKVVKVSNKKLSSIGVLKKEVENSLPESE